MRADPRDRWWLGRVGRLTLLLSVTLATSVQAQPVRDGWLPMPDGARLHYREQGRSAPGAPAIVLATGWTVPIDIWAPLMTRLGRTHRVIAIEPRGQGRSTHATDALTPEARADDLAVALRRLAVERAVLVGWSLGAIEVLAYVERHGDARVAALALLDQPASPDTSSAMRTAVARAAERLLRDRVGETRRFAAGMVVRPLTSADSAALVVGMLRTPTRNAIALMFGEASADLGPVLPRLRMPVLVLSPAGPAAAPLGAMTTRIPRGRHVPIADAGHALFLDQPAVVAALLDTLAQGAGRP